MYVEGTGELIGATHFLGTPHPTGYPLFCLVGRLFSAFLPFASVAYKINMATAFTGALTATALTLFLHWRGCQAWTALAAGLGFGFSSTFWSQAVIAEVYGLSSFAVVVVMAAGIQAVEKREDRWFVVLGFLMGLGLTTHLSHVLVWPGLAILLGWRWKGRWPGPILLGKALLAAVGGYSLVLYLPLRNGRGPGFHWDPLDTLDQLWGHLSGALYRPSFGAIPWEGALLNAQRWGFQIMEEFHPLLVVLPVWGGWVAWKRDRGTAIVAGLTILANLGAAWNYHRDPNGLGVFFLLSVLGLAIFLGFGLEDIARRLVRVLPGSLAPVVVGTLVVLVVLVGNYQKSDRSRNWIPYQYGRDILEGLPRDAVLLAAGDTAAFLLDYLVRVEGMRPDVAYYSRIGRGTDLLRADEHRFSPGRQNKIRIQREAQLIRRGQRPVFYLYPTNKPLKDHTFVPLGLCYQISPDPVLPDTVKGHIKLENARKTDLYRDPWVRKIQAHYWFMLGEQQHGLGHTERAFQAYQKAAEIAYDSRSMRLNVAIVHYKENRLKEALRHAQAARDIDPWQVQSYRLMGRILRRMGKYQEAAELLKGVQLLKGAP